MIFFHWFLSKNIVLLLFHKRIRECMCVRQLFTVWVLGDTSHQGGLRLASLLIQVRTTLKQSGEQMSLKKSRVRLWTGTAFGIRVTGVDRGAVVVLCNIGRTDRRKRRRVGWRVTYFRTVVKMRPHPGEVAPFRGLTWPTGPLISRATVFLVDFKSSDSW